MTIPLLYVECGYLAEKFKKSMNPVIILCIFLFSTNLVGMALTQPEKAAVENIESTKKQRFILVSRRKKSMYKLLNSKQELYTAYS